MTTQILFCFIAAFQISLVSCRNDLYQQYLSRHDKAFPVTENVPVVQGADPCDPNVCENGGTCLVISYYYMVVECICTPEYYGYKCEQSRLSTETTPLVPTPDPCAPNPCKNGGTCWSYMGDVTCDCSSNYLGTRCEKDPCASNPCKNGGTCRINYMDEVTCDCSIGYYGTRCENDFDSGSAVPTSSIVGIVVAVVVLILMIILRCYYYRNLKTYWSRSIIVVTPRREPFEGDHQEDSQSSLPPPYDTVVPVQQQNHPPSK